MRAVVRKARLRMQDVCDKLGIDFYVMNFKDMFKDKVVDYFVDEYIHGRTPNPCIACNKYLKFDALLKALAMGIDYVATGHYAKIEKGEDGKYILRARRRLRKTRAMCCTIYTRTACTYINAWADIIRIGYVKRRKNSDLALHISLTVRKYALLKMMIMRNL